MRKITHYIMFVFAFLFTACENEVEVKIPDSIQVPTEVRVRYEGETASVTVPELLKDSITYSINGAKVTLTSICTSTEVFYHLSGKSDNGSLLINGSYKFTMILHGLELTNTFGGAIDIQCGKRINVVLSAGTTSRLIDSPFGSHRASFYCRGHLEFSGSGTLEIEGNLSHALNCKEYLEIKPSTGNIIINKAVRDAIHCGEYFLMRGGTITVNSAGRDCIDSDDFGNVTITGGKLNLNVTSPDGKGIKCDSTMTVTGGEFTIVASGNGSKGITVRQSMFIGTTELAEEGAKKPIIEILATGDVYDPTGDNTKCMGIRVEKDLTIASGTIRVTNTGEKSEGIKVVGSYTVSDLAEVDANLDLSKEEVTE